MKRMQRWVCAFAAIVVPAFGAPPAPPAPSADEQFAHKVAAADMDEVEAAKFAQKHASNAAVHQFADRMVQDHTKADKQLRGIASSMGISLPDKMDKSAEQDLDRLSKLHGADFDKAYMKHNVSAHQSAIKDFRKEAKSGKDERLKKFAGQLLPTLEEHLRMAQSAAQAVGASKPT